MNALIDAALAKLDRMKHGDYPYPDDDIVVIPRGGNPGAGPVRAAALFDYDADIPRSSAPRGPRSSCATTGRRRRRSSVPSVSPSRSSCPCTAPSTAGTKVLSIRSFLSANAVRSTNSLDGIDDCSTNNATLCACVDPCPRAVRRDGRALFRPRRRA